MKVPGSKLKELVEVERQTNSNNKGRWLTKAARVGVFEQGEEEVLVELKCPVILFQQLEDAIKEEGKIGGLLIHPHGFGVPLIGQQR